MLRYYTSVLVYLISASAVFGAAPTTQAQTDSAASAQSGLTLAEFRPRSMLKVKQTDIRRARYPVVDVHTHFGHRMRTREELNRFVTVMDRNQIAVCVSMDGTLVAGLAEQEDFLWRKFRNRFVIFARVNWQGDGAADDPVSWDCNQPDFVRRTVLQLRAAAQNGVVSGLKLAKGFGLSYRDAQGQLLKIDDSRWDPIWKTCGELGLPVLIHTADPAAFFLPIDETNERWEELSRHPDWSFYGAEFPSRDALLEARNRVIARHPKTQFIGAHMGNNPEDLGKVGEWLDAYPNLHVEFASRIGELGRQPYTARRFLIKYADRILFGSDGPWPERRLRLYWRFLETDDEFFPYSEKPVPPQGLWNIYGMFLPDEVLRKIYYRNAARLIPGVAERLSQQ